MGPCLHSPSGLNSRSKNSYASSSVAPESCASAWAWARSTNARQAGPVHDVGGRHLRENGWDGAREEGRHRDARDTEKEEGSRCDHGDRFLSHATEPRKIIQEGSGFGREARASAC